MVQPCMRSMTARPRIDLVAIVFCAIIASSSYAGTLARIDFFSIPPRLGEGGRDALASGRVGIFSVGNPTRSARRPPSLAGEG